MWLIWILSLYVVCPQVYSLNFWPNMDDLDPQLVCGLLTNLLTQFLNPTWLILTLRKCVVCSQIHSLDFWFQNGWFGLLACVWFALKPAHLISNLGMVDLNFQGVRSLLSNLVTQFLTLTWDIGLSQFVRSCSQIHLLKFWPQHYWYGLSGSVWFALESTCSISEPNMVDFDSQEVRGLLSNLLTQFLILTLFTQLLTYCLTNCLIGLSYVWLSTSSDLWVILIWTHFMYSKISSPGF